MHARVGELLGRIRLTLFMHAGQCLQRGYAAPFDAPEHGPRADDERRRCLDATGFEGTRITLITGRSNQLWHRESVDQMYEWLVGALRRVSGPLAPRDFFELARCEGEAFGRILEGFASQSVQDFAGAGLAGRAGLLEIEERGAQALNGALVVTRGDGP